MFPSVLNTFTRPTTTDRLNNPSHSALHNTVSSALGQVEAVIGVDGASSIVGTIMYNLRSPASNGGGHVQTANKGGTGQTTYTKGDILVATSSSVLTKLAVGEDNSFLKANSSVAGGIQWGSNVLPPAVKVYGYSSSVITWNKPSILSYITVEVQGGGGGGGGTTANNEACGGGGGGGYARKTINSSVLGLTEQVWVGVGGTAGAGSGGNGGNGGAAIFGATSIISATGGNGGGGGGSNAAGGGGVGSNGDINSAGGDGQTGFNTGTVSINMGGQGGSSHYGGGGGGGVNGQAGIAGDIYGGGGGGAGGDGSDRAGGAGANGVVIITEY